MKLHPLFLVVVLAAASADALRISVKQSRAPSVQRRSSTGTVALTRPVSALDNVKQLAAGGSDGGLDISTVRDLIYMANITVGGTEYLVQLDTGSSDLWIKGPSYPLPGATESSITYNMTYGIGWANGSVAYAPVQFAGINVAQQAFLDVSSANNPALSYGGFGILGLGFTSLSEIDALVNKTNSSNGRSVLFNAFADNPSEPNFIAFSLERSDGPSDEVTGSFSIGEYEPAYADVANSPALPTWPVNSPKRWNVLLDAVLVGNRTIPVSTNVTGAPSNRAVVLLDSGTSYTYLPVDVCTAIYGDIPGASYDADLGQWIIPCTAEVDMALQLGGQVFPLHPLDISPESLTNSSQCVGSFVPQAVAVGAGSFDWLLGDNVLRSIYSVYDFGDFDSSGNMGNPYVKLLSVITPDQASSDFAAARNTTARSGITYNASNSTATASSSPASVTVSSDVANMLDKISTYFPIIAAIMALNVVALLVLIIVAVVFMCRRNRGRNARPRSAVGRSTPGRLSPMPTNANSQGRDLAPPPNHAYEPVSMAMSDDTAFSTPSPGFKYDPDSAKGMSRPQSLANSMSRLNVTYPPTADITEPSDEPFNPPSFPKMRPNSSSTNASRLQSPLVEVKYDDNSESPFNPPSSAISGSRPSASASSPRGKRSGSIDSTSLESISESPFDAPEPPPAVPPLPATIRPVSTVPASPPRSSAVPKAAADIANAGSEDSLFNIPAAAFANTRPTSTVVTMQAPPRRASAMHAPAVEVTSPGGGTDIPLTPAFAAPGGRPGSVSQKPSRMSAVPSPLAEPASTEGASNPFQPRSRSRSSSSASATGSVHSRSRSNSVASGITQPTTPSPLGGAHKRSPSQAQASPASPLGGGPQRSPSQAPPGSPLGGAPQRSPSQGPPPSPLGAPQRSPSQGPAPPLPGGHQRTPSQGPPSPFGSGPGHQRNPPQGPTQPLPPTHYGSGQQRASTQGPPPSPFAGQRQGSPSPSPGVAQPPSPFVTGRPTSVAPGPPPSPFNANRPNSVVPSPGGAGGPPPRMSSMLAPSGSEGDNPFRAPAPGFKYDPEGARGLSRPHSMQPAPGQRQHGQYQGPQGQFQGPPPGQFQGQQGQFPAPPRPPPQSPRRNVQPGQGPPGQQQQGQGPDGQYNPTAPRPAFAGYDNDRPRSMA